MKKRPSSTLIDCAAAAVLVCGIFAAARGVEPPAGGPRTRNASARQLKTVQSELDALQKHHQARLDGVAQDFADMGLSADADRCRQLAAPMATALFRFKKPPKEVKPPIPLSLPEKERELRLSLRKIESDFGADLYRLSRKALNAGYPSFAYQLVQEVVKHEPDHPGARRILGFQLRNKEWVTPFAASMLNAGYVWDDTFGWLKKEYVANYRAGKRYYGGWRSAEQEAEIRRDFEQAWDVRTDHFRVRTNHSLERGVEIAKALEQYHDFFMQTFAAFFSKPEQMRKLFQASSSSSAARSSTHRYEVHYYRTRDEYMRRLKQKVPQIAITNGLYYTADRVSYFYFDPNRESRDTLFHEATHQFFYENLRPDRMIALDENFWIVEGIACYMESYRAANGQYVVGDPRHARIEAARHRCVVDNYYVPLARFTAMGMREFQSSNDITKNYSQASGLAHFFMHYDGGRYRDALIRHLSEIYEADPRRKEAVESLADLTEVPFPELDRQYADYMRSVYDGATRAEAGR